MLEDMLRSMAAHAAEFPNHGYNCACKDIFIRDGKKFLKENKPLIREFMYFAQVARNDIFYLAQDDRPHKENEDEQVTRY